MASDLVEKLVLSLHSQSRSMADQAIKAAKIAGFYAGFEAGLEEGEYRQQNRVKDVLGIKIDFRFNMDAAKYLKLEEKSE
jgi:hypothetical protein